MTVELTMLVYTVLLFFVVVAVAGGARGLQVGVVAAAGPRDDLPAPTLFVARAQRTVMNHIEGLVIFAPTVLVANAAGVSTDMTVLGAQIFFVSRLAHAAAYLVGLPWVRTLVFLAGVVGWAMILVPLLTAG